VTPGGATAEEDCMDQQAQRPTWWSRNWKWFVPVLVLVVLVLVAGAVATVYLFVSVVFGALKSSGGYQEALTAARSDSAVVRALGTPIKDGLLPAGDVNTSGSTGRSDLAIPVSGPKGSGTLYVKATRSASGWSFTELVLKVEGSGETIDLLAGSSP